MFRPGDVWLDTDGQPIQAHGGGMLVHRGVYYWFGENKDAATVPSAVVEYQIARPVGISCYSSTDLYHWTHEGVVLRAAAVQAQETEALRVMERPKVLYNARTRQFVMWFHADDADYSLARIGIATSDRPTGPYTYRGSIRPAGHDSRDMTLYQDDDGTAVVVFASAWNQTLRVARLADDYLSTSGQATCHLIGQHREAPAVFRHHGRYYLLTSGCTGWDPNAALYAVAPTVFGPWEAKANPCVGPGADRTFDAQGTYVLPVAGRPGAFIFMADRWKKHDLRDSRYVWLPIRFDGEVPVIEWRDEWDWADL